MKLNYFKFQDGKVFWLPEYLEKPNEDDYKGLTYGLTFFEIDMREYLIDVKRMLASAIEVTPEDAERIRNFVTGVESINEKWGPQVDRHGIQKDKVYSAECEMERGYQVLIQKTWHNTPKENYDKWSDNGTEPQYRQVAHLKPKDIKKNLKNENRSSKIS